MLPKELVVEAREIPNRMRTKHTTIDQNVSGEKRAGDWIEFVIPKSDTLMYLPSLKVKLQGRTNFGTAFLQVSDAIIDHLIVEIGGHQWSCRHYGRLAGMRRLYEHTNDEKEAFRHIFNVRHDATPNGSTNTAVIPNFYWGPLNATYNKYLDCSLSPITIRIKLIPDFRTISLRLNADNSTNRSMVLRGFDDNYITYQEVKYDGGIFSDTVKRMRDSGNLRLAFRNLYTRLGKLQKNTTDNHVTNISYKSEHIQKIYVTAMRPDYLHGITITEGDGHANINQMNRGLRSDTSLTVDFKTSMGGDVLIDRNVRIDEVWSMTDYALNVENNHRGYGGVKWDMTAARTSYGYQDHLMFVMNVGAPGLGDFISGVNNTKDTNPISVEAVGINANQYMLVGVESTSFLEFNQDGYASVRE